MKFLRFMFLRAVQSGTRRVGNNENEGVYHAEPKQMAEGRADYNADLRDRRNTGVRSRPHCHAPISAALANEAVEAAVSFCASQGHTESAAIVDIDGVALATLRGDGAGVHTPDSAIDKAYTSVSLKSDTLALVSTVQDQLTPAGPFSKLPHLLLFGGGVTIKLGVEVIGAIGAAGAPGGKLDDACARAGLDKIKDRLK